MAYVFDGKQFAATKEELLKKRVALLKQQGVFPKLVWVSVGDAEQNQLYGRIKGQAAERLGIEFEKKEFSAGTDVETIIEEIEMANLDKDVHGVMVQLPIKTKSEKLKVKSYGNFTYDVLAAIDPKKDVDCLTPENLGRLMMGKPRFLPATVASVVEVLSVVLKESLLKEELTPAPIFSKEVGSPSLDKEGVRGRLIGKRVAVVGGGLEVGRPLVNHLSNRGAIVLWVRASGRENLSEYTKWGEIIISATGKESLIKGDMVQDGAIVVDVGSPKGDFDFDSVKNKASFITPVPGGVGPVTVMSLMENVIKVAENTFYF